MYVQEAHLAECYRLQKAPQHLDARPLELDVCRKIQEDRQENDARPQNNEEQYLQQTRASKRLSETDRVLLYRARAGRSGLGVVNALKSPVFGMPLACAH